MINISNLSYRYKSGTLALNDITTNIGPGIHLLLGANGAGKTTLLHIISGLLFPTDGICTFDSYDVSRRQPAVMQQLFFITDNMKFPMPTINEFKKVHASFYPSFSDEMLAKNLIDFGMTGDEQLSKMSLGNQKKAQLAYALALRTPLLLLDEPANGLDIDTKKILQTMLSRCISEDQTLIISTHTVQDFQYLFDGILMLSEGKCIISRPVWEITEKIAFIDSAIPPVGNLYSEPEFGLFHSIIENTEGISSNVNYQLLYSALHSPSRSKILNIINSDKNELA